MLDMELINNNSRKLIINEKQLLVGEITTGDNSILFND